VEHKGTPALAFLFWPEPAPLLALRRRAEEPLFSGLQANPIAQLHQAS